MKFWIPSETEKSLGLLLFRFFLGYLLMAPLYSVLFRIPGGIDTLLGQGFMTFVFIALLAVSFIGGTLLILGLWTRAASLIIFFFYLWLHIFFTGFVSPNIYENFLYLAIFLTGAGTYSLDYKVFKTE
jgi:uncharacterized membrane protein YphA (DoxX/SURF4 family)